MTTDTEHLTLAATLQLWRVFGMTDIFADRPERWEEIAEAGPLAGDHMKIVFGEPPVEVIDALTQLDAQGNGLVELQVGHIRSAAELNELYERDLPEARTHVFDEPYPSWLALSLSRSIKPLAQADWPVGWAADPKSLYAAMARFEAEGNVYLDSTVPRLLSAMGHMNPGRLLYGDRRAFCIAPGRAAIRIPKFTMTIADWGAQVTRAGGWAAAAPMAPLAEALAKLSTSKVDSALTADAAEWFLLATAEQDDLRRFVFAFAGLELLASQVAKHRRSELVGRLTGLDESAPWTELLWPATDDERVNRNLVFKFSLLAYMYSPSTANDDVATCKALMKFRNNLFHGGHSEIEFRENSIICKEMLRRYLAAVACAETIS